MFKKINLVLVFLLQGIVSISFAQELLTPSRAFSHEKTIYITKMDGTELKGVLDDLDRKKGLIESVRILNIDGTKVRLKAIEIKFMYLYPSGLASLTKSINTYNDVQKWTDEKLNNDLFNRGYIYIEQSEVFLKKKKEILLLQLLNPSFSKFVKIYDDPRAGKTASVGVGSFTLAGGNEKSYYFKKGDEVAYKLERSDYTKSFKLLWSDCEKLMLKYTHEPHWRDLSKHAFEYSECK